MRAKRAEPFGPHESDPGSAEPVTVLVAFPMPEIRIDEPDQSIALPTEDPVNFLAFTTTVNGAPVKFRKTIQISVKVTNR